MAATDQDNSVPFLRAVVATLFPQAYIQARRIVVDDKDGLSLDHLGLAINEINDPAARELLRPKVIAAFLDQLGRYRYRDHDRAAALVTALASFVTGRWDDYATPISRLVLDSPYSSDLFDALPVLRSDANLISALAARITHDEHFSAREATKVLQNIEIPSSQLVRVLLVATMRRRSDRSRDEWHETDLTLFASSSRGLGWTPWSLLLGILIYAPKLAEEPLVEPRLISPSNASNEIITAFNEFEAEVRANPAVRGLAIRLRELLAGESSFDSRGLLHRPAETREAYIEALGKTCRHDEELRRAAIEILLWLPRDRAVDFAQYVATRLAHPDDKPFLTSLSAHPERLVVYGANAVERAVFGNGQANNILSPRAGGNVLESLSHIGLSNQPDTEPAQTWLGDRIVERLIENTVRSVEDRFAREYVDHSEEGEEKLLAMMFEALSSSFAALDQSLEAIARAASAPRRATVSMRYRTVDKAEEGAAGIKRSKSFSTDLCLIVDPTLDGLSLGRRVTLVQAKRLYREKPLRVKPRWHHSFQLKAAQIKSLMKQTESSVFFFQGPVLGGRGVPVIPTRLVQDLASHQGGTGTRLAHETVAIASRSLADWFTYDLLALRVGDPLQALVSKAEGTPGSLPRRLLSMPRVEIEVGMVIRSEGRRRG